MDKQDVNIVIEYYQNGGEDGRMERNPLEYLRSKEIISRYLTKPEMNILDVGGATGAYSFWLSEQGHRVSLVDFTPKHIDIAKMRQAEKGVQLASAFVADARDLPHPSDSFDLVLLMGPMYHLVNKGDRLKALTEAKRVLKPGGTLICAVISRYASVLDGFTSEYNKNPEFLEIMRQDLKNGLHRNLSGAEGFFTDAYFHHPDEVPAELTEAGLCFEKVIAITSFGWILPDINENFKNEIYREALLETLRHLETEPSIMGVSSHFMGVARKE